MIRSLAFFGAFNPPTRAHTDLAELAMRASGREKVIFVPSKMEYIRDEQKKSFAFDDRMRLEMLAKIAENRPWMHYTDLEIRQDRQPRTWHTLCMLRDRGESPSLLIGADKLEELEMKWAYVPEIADEFGIVCMNRGDMDCEEIIGSSAFLRSLRICVVSVPDAYRDISSSKVRECLWQLEQLREELNGLLPPELNSLPADLLRQAPDGRKE